MRILFLSLPLALLTSPLYCDDEPREQDPTIAIIDGAPVAESELKLRSQLMQLERQAYELRQRTLENLIGQKLLEKAAAAKNLSTEELLKQEVDSKIPEPSPQEVEGYYWGQKEKFNQPLEVVRDQAARMLKSVKIRDARQTFLRELREKSSVTILLEPPRLPVEVGQAPRRGPASAPVTIVEYSDFQCPYCKRVQSTLNELRAKYGDRVSLVFKDLPLTRIHPEAQRAAEAARCAGDQGKYWEYHDALFAAPALQRSSYPELAKSLELDAAEFQKCVDSQKYQSQVQADLQEAQNLGIQSTPTFLINGVPLAGAQPAEAFTKLIDSELDAAKRRNATTVSGK